MPALEEIDRGNASTDLEAFLGHLRTICTKHLDRVTRVVIERRNRGAGSGRIPSSVAVKRDPDSPDAPGALVDEIVERVEDIIRRDAGLPRGRETPNKGRVGPYWGAAVLLDENKPAAKQVIDEAVLQIDDPEAAFSEQHALVEITRVMVKGYDAMSKATGNLHRWSAQREKQQAKRDAAVAKLFRQIGKVMRGGSKYDFKARKAESRDNARVETARAAQAQSAHFWGAATELGKSWHDVALAWTTWFTTPSEKTGKTPTEPPRAPTADEIEKVCGNDEDFERRFEIDGEHCSVRTLLAEMLAEADPQRRLELGKRLLAVFNRDPVAAQKFVLRVRNILGNDRARELAAWLQLPV